MSGMIPDDFPVKVFREKLIQWWKHNRRSFPWRNSSNPYDILIAEILLHRTKADQVTPIYQNFLKQFSSFAAIASAPQSEVIEMLFPLGLRWRSEGLYQMALEIVEKHNGKVPEDRDNLESLPGVSHYIASAVRCFAFGSPEVLLDTNTVRIIGRLFGIPVTDGSRRSKRFRELLQSLLDPNQPGKFNLAMIDLGALVCRPNQPLCNLCPINEVCNYARQIQTKGVEN